MDREIKFRGKRADNGDWAYGDLEYNRAKGIARIHSYDDNGNYIGQNVVDESTVGQFTVLKDCNGREIYEGDFVRYYDDIEECYEESVIEYDTEYCGFIIKNSDGDAIPLSRHMHFTVFANIHDNPELIK